VAQTLMRELTGRAAHVEIDSIMRTLSIGDGDHWEDGLPVAYDVAAATAETLLLHDFTVLFDSTFTFVPSDGREGQWHAEQLRRLESLAGEVGAAVTVVRLRARLPELLRRRSLTGRLNDELVEEIWRLHERSFEGATPSLNMCTDDLESGEVERRVAGLAQLIAQEL